MQQFDLNGWSLDSITLPFLSFLTQRRTFVKMSVGFHKDKLKKVNCLQKSHLWVEQTRVRQLHFTIRFRRFGKKIHEKCLLSADFNELDCIRLPRLIMIPLPCTFSLMTLTAHIAKAMKHWWELSCSTAYATAIVGRDQQAVSFLAEMHFCQHLLQPMKTVLLDTDAAHWGLRTDYSNSREGKASVPDLLSGKLDFSYSSCCHSLEPRQHFPWWLHNLRPSSSAPVYILLILTGIKHQAAKM